jgi:DNA-binding MarR family transcriptional regulator
METHKDGGAEELAGLLGRITRMANLASREDAVCCGVTVSQCHILLGLWEAGSTTMKALSHRLGIAPSTLTRTIEPLVAQGWVLRAPSDDDRRQVIVTLSPEGRGKARELSSYQQALCLRLLEGLADEERERLMSGLRAFIEMMERMMHEACCPEGPHLGRP